MTNTAAKINVAQRSDFPRIAELFTQQNSDRRFRCLHSHEGAVEATLATMNQYADEDSFSMVYATDGAGNVIGAFGGEYDPEIKRAWLWGPSAANGNSDPDGWLELCQQMYEALIPTLPFEPAILDGFIDQPFELGEQLYQRCGHHLAKTIYVFVAPRPAAAIPPGNPLSTLMPEQSDSLIPLFDNVFPDTYYTGAQIAARQSDTEKTFVHLDDGVVTGFCHVKLNEGAKDGYVDFVGVDANARRRGIAKRLLHSAMHWLFTTHNVPEIGLTTGDDNVNAQALYRQVGFEVESVGLAYRKERGRQGEGETG